MVTDDEIADGQQPRWFIDVDWLEAHNRSFLAMAGSCLCLSCRKRLFAEGRAATLEEVLGAIRDCCSHAEGYISSELPVMESAFRLFLASNNEALGLIELGRRLSERRGIDTYRTSVGVLSRLLKNDEYYGLRQAPD